MYCLHRASIRCVVFDVVGTLIYADPPVARAYADAAKRFGSRKSEPEIAAAFRRCFDAAEAASRAAGLETSEDRERQWWREIVAEVLDDVVDLDGCFEALFDHFGRPEAWRCYDDAPQALAALREAGFTLALASNFDARLHAIRKGLGVLSGMHPVVVSTEVGFRKPHGAFFDALVRETGLPRSSIVHVGDSLINDHQGAISAGLESVWLCRNGPRAAEPCVTDLATLADLLTGKNPRPAGG